MMVYTLLIVWAMNFQKIAAQMDSKLVVGKTTELHPLHYVIGGSPNQEKGNFDKQGLENLHKPYL